MRAALAVHESGYRLVSTSVLDLFPHTANMETLAVSEKAA